MLIWCSWTQRNIIRSNLNALLWEMQLKILVAKCLPFCLITHWQWMSYQRTISLSNFVTRAFAVLYYSDVIMSGMASQISSLTIVYSTVHSSGADQRKHQSSVSQVFVRWIPRDRWINRWPVNSPHKGLVTRKIFHLMTSSWTHLGWNIMADNSQTFSNAFS